MTRTLEATGKTVAEATANALKQLGVSSDQAEITVVNRGRRGLFGIFPGTQARVRASLRLATRDRAETILKELLRHMHISCQLDVVERRHDLHISIETAGTDSLLIGKGALTLYSLEYLVNRMLQNEDRKGQKVLLEVAGYKRRREDEPSDDEPGESRGRRGGRRSDGRRDGRREGSAGGSRDGSRAPQEEPVGAAAGTGTRTGRPGGRRRSGRGRRRRGTGGGQKLQPQSGEQS